MPAISKIRFTNVIYEGGAKRYNDDIFLFDGHNGIILLENGGGKTVFIQTAIQAVLPHQELAERKIKDTLLLQGCCAHVAIEWILNEQPRRYALTAVTLFIKNERLDSHRYVYEYEAGDSHAIENIPFVHTTPNGVQRPASQGEIQDYYQHMSQKSMLAQTFPTITAYHNYIEENFKIIPSEWKKIVDINGAEGEIEGFFEGCQTTTQLVDRLLIPTVEEALSGNSAEDFVELFDKQREHFKEHKQLQKRLDENKNIEERVNHFVTHYQTLQQYQQKLLHDKQQAKAFFGLTTQEKKVNDQQQQHLKEQYEKHSAAQQRLERKKKSLEIRVLEEQRDELKAQYQQALEQYFKYQNQLEGLERRYQSLEIAQIKHKLTEYQQRRHLLEQQLQQLQQSPETVQLEAELLLVRQQLKGYFIKTEQELQKELQTKEQLRQQYEQEKDNMYHQLNQLHAKQNQITGKIATIEQEIKSATNQMAQLKKRILINPTETQVEIVLPQLERETVQLEENQWNYNQQIKELNKEKSYLTEVIAEKSGALGQIGTQLTQAAENIKNIEAAGERLKEQLINRNTEFAGFNSLYKQEASIIAQVEEKVEYLHKQKQELLEQERLAFRFVDDHGQQQTFTADPLLEKLYERWLPQFSYLELGSSFIERALQSGDDIGGSTFPFWPLTLITAEDDIEKLVNKLAPQRDELTHPVIILSSMEARTFLEGHMVDVKVMEPTIWQTNVQKEQFAAWQEQITIEAQQIKQRRQQCDEAYSHWGILLASVREFYHQYPFTSYEKLKQQQLDLSKEQTNHKNALLAAQERLSQVEEEQKRYHQHLREAERAKANIEQRLAYAQDYMAQKAIIAKAEIEKHHWLQQQRVHQREYNGLEQGYSEQLILINDINTQISKLGVRLEYLQADQEYKSVKSLEPVFSEQLLPTLKSRQRAVEAALNEKLGDRQTIQSQINSCSDDIDAQNIALKIKQTNARHDIDDSLIFPPYGQQELLKLAEDIKRLEGEIVPYKVHYKRLEMEKTKKETELNTRTKDFAQFFSHQPIDQFSEPLAMVHKKLQSEEKQLAEQEQAITRQQEQLQQELKIINDAYHQLNIANGRFGFLAEEIEVAILAEQVATNYPYQRKEMLNQLFARLADGEKQVEQKQQEIVEQRQILIDYCNQEVKDIRMRQDVIVGLKNKRNYTEILEWHNRMQQRIQHIMLIIEGDLRKHNIGLEQFITHLHSHLKRIRVELEQLPKKTRVKVDDKWKDIYIFNVPDWQEETGKEELRRQIYWMLGELEDIRFKDESGKEDDAKVKKAIEKWMQSKQLLRAVMKNETIKVKCRKVTNDGKVGGGLHSWEESNRWSGGEKWSKNMTLFLGILNYLAEKRQHIHHNVKRHRSVIMDNPFGKASSDHVLEPVFFVAEQLGFQIITLTAHTEGAFIRNYFPVVYSCRLRQAEESDKLVMTKEKEIKKAYFHDHDPQSLERLGEYKQLSLF